MKETARKIEWQPMELTRVGNVADVMQKKSGPHFDPSYPIHSIKSGNGP
jgi:hypothetical protein